MSEKTVAGAMGLMPDPEPPIPVEMEQTEEQLREQEIRNASPTKAETKPEIPPVQNNETHPLSDTSLPSKTVSDSFPESAVPPRREKESEVFTDTHQQRYHTTDEEEIERCRKAPQFQREEPPPKTTKIGPTDFEMFLNHVSTNVDKNLVALQIQVMGNNPMVLPPILLWDLPVMDFVASVTQLMANKDFLRMLWPTLQVLMGSNIRNDQWTASVAITLAVFSVLSAVGEQRQKKE